MSRSFVNGAAPEEKPEKPEAALSARDVSLGYGERLVIRELSFAVTMGQITVLVGPQRLRQVHAAQGAGPPARAQLRRRLSGRPRHSAASPRVKSPAACAILPQGPVAPAGLTVGELVEQGRYPHAGPLRMLRHQDYAAIAEALALTGMTDFARARWTSLSGGERQRAWIALALAQATPVLLLDEPTTFLDIGHQLEVLELVRRLNDERGMTIVLVLHDLNQAARYADRMVALNSGRNRGRRPAADVLTAALLAEVFGVRARILPHPVDGVPLCLPFATADTAHVKSSDAETAITPTTETAEKTAGQRVGS